MRRPRPVLRRHEVERSPKLLHGLTVRNVSLQRAGSFRWMPAEPSSVEHYVLETSGISRHPPTCAGFHSRHPLPDLPANLCADRLSGTRGRLAEIDEGLSQRESRLTDAPDGRPAPPSSARRRACGRSHLPPV